MYPEPAWDQIKGAGRFVVLTNWNSEAVLDKETGLVWERAPVTNTFTWDAALLTCTARTTGGRKGWRLPSVHELASLLDPTQRNQALPVGHPFIGVQSADYWSATMDAEFPTLAWSVHFGLGLVGPNDKSLNGQVWCVRDGMHADQY